MTESSRRRKFGRASESREPSVTESVPRGVRVAAAWSWRTLVIVAVIALFVWLIVALRIIVIPVMIALLLAALLVPFSSFLQRHRWPKWLAVVVAYFSLLIVVGGLLTLGASQIARASADLTKQTRHAWESWSQLLADSPLHISPSQIDQWIAGLFKSLESDNGQLLHGALSLGSTVGHVFTGLLLTMFTTLFFLIDGPGIWRWIVNLFPAKAIAAIDGAGRAGWTTLTSFVRVQILVAFVDAVGIGLGAALLGVPLAIPIAILVFLGSFIPIVGAIVTGALASFIALVYNGPWIALALLVITLLVHQIEGHVLQPLIMGTAVKVHPLAVVLVVATGTFLAGIPGALFAVPVAATLNSMISFVVRGGWRADHPPAGADPLWSVVSEQPFRSRGKRDQP